MNPHESLAKTRHDSGMHLTATRVADRAKILPIATMSTRALTRAETESVRRRIQLLVERYGSQSAAAKKLGIGQQTLSSVLRGNPTGLYVAKRVAAACGVPLEQILGTGVPALDDLVASHPDRWSEWAIASVKAAPGVKRMQASELRKLLDEVNAVLSAVHAVVHR